MQAQTINWPIYNTEDHRAPSNSMDRARLIAGSMTESKKGGLRRPTSADNEHLLSKERVASRVHCDAGYWVKEQNEPIHRAPACAAESSRAQPLYLDLNLAVQLAYRVGFYLYAWVLQANAGG